MKTSNPLAIFFLSVVAINAARADEIGEPRSQVVQFADLDLAKTEGAVVLFARIRQAAKTVCAPFNDGTIRRKQQFASCVDLALTNAVARVNQPMLSEYFINRSPAPAPTKIARAR